MARIDLTLCCILLILLLPNFVSAQLLVREGNQWNIAIYPTFSPNTSSYSLRIGEDTLVNNQLYYKVYYSSDSLNSSWTFRNDLLRQDSSKRVYHKRRDADEFLLYDFSLQVNDTIQLDEYCTLRVLEVDSIELNNGELRKRLKLTKADDPHWGEQYWINGIGSEFGMLSHFGYCYTDYSNGLLCFYQNGEILYPENPPSCFITGVGNLEELTSVNVFPNPFSSYLIIEDEEKGMEQYLIYNNLGQYMQGGGINNSFLRIELEGLPRGLFYLILMDRERRKYSTRLVKQ